jgi:hypothetical protein
MTEAKAYVYAFIRYNQRLIIVCQVYSHRGRRWWNKIMDVLTRVRRHPGIC